MSLKRTLLTATLLAMAPAVVASTALAQGFYIGGGGGYSIPEDSDLEGAGINSDVDLEDDFAIHGMFGYAFQNGFRAEIESGWRENDIDSLGGTSGDGSVEALHLMVNGLYDFNTGTKFVPYVGAGIGAAFLSMDGGAVGGLRVNDDDDTVFAYQGILGVAYRFHENLDAYLDYRYMSTLDANFNTSTNTEVETDYTDHRIMAGLRFYFGGPKPAPAPVPVAAPAPTPPPPPAPAPRAEAPRNYLVFFDFDQSTLTADAQGILRNAANNFREGKLTRVEATGHADKAGPSAYNQRLSMRRAEAVKAELVRLGIPANQIGVSWKGEEQPLVQTPDGVREPQNRRVEIVLN